MAQGHRGVRDAARILKHEEPESLFLASMLSCFHVYPILTYISLTCIYIFLGSELGHLC